MAFDVCVVQADSVSGTQNIALPTGFGTPTTCIAIITTAIFGGTNPHHQARMGVGFSDGTVQRGCECQSRDDRLIADTYRWTSNTYSLLTLAAGGASVRSEASITFSTDQITFTWNTHAAGSGMVFLVFTGTDDVWIGDYTHDGDTDDVNGRASTTAPGFEPDVVFMATNRTASAASGSSEAMFTFGVAVNDGSETQKSFAFGSKDAANPVKCSAALWTDKICKPVHDNTTFEGISIYSFDVNGFTTEIDDLSAGKTVPNSICLAIKLPAGEGVDVVHTQVPAGSPPTDHVITSSLSFKPKAQLVMGTLLSSAGSRDDTAGASCFALGASYDAASDDEYSFSYRDEDGKGGFGTETVCWNQSLGQTYFVEDSDGVGGNEATTKSYDSNGVTWTWNPKDFIGKDFFVVFFSGKPTAGGSAVVGGGVAGAGAILGG